MASVGEIICQCVDTLRSNSTEANEVTATLLQIYENFENLPELFALHQQTEDQYVKELVLIGIKNIVRSHLESGEMPLEILEFVKKAIVEGLQLDIGALSKIWYCYIAGIIFDNGNGTDYPEIIELAGAFLSNEEQIETGIRLWTNICKNISAEQIMQYIEPLVQSITAVLNADNGDVRLCAVQLLCAIMFRSPSYDIFIENEEFQAAMQLEYSKVINDPEVKDDERAQVIETISMMMRSEDMFPIIEPSFQQLYHATLEGFYNEELPAIRRLETLNFFNAVIETNPSLASTILDNIIERIIPLTVEQCNIEGRENFEPHYGDVTFRILASDEELADDLISQVLSVSKETVEAQETDVTLLQVVIQLLSSLAVGSGETILQYEEDVSTLLLIGLGSEDECMIKATCGSILEISEEVPSLFNIRFGDYLQALIQLYEHEDAIPTLDMLFNNVDVSLENTTEVISALLEIAGSEGIDPCSIIRCISSCISCANAKNVDPSLYPTLREFLTSAISEDMSINEAVFECFSNCCCIAPKNIVEDLPDLFEKMASMLTPENADSVPNIARALTNFANYFTVSIQPYVPQCSELLVQFMVNDMKNTNAISSEEQIQSEKIKEQEIQGNVLNCLASFVASFPEEMMPHIEGILTVACQWLTSDEDEEDNIYQAADAISKMAPGLHCMEIDPNELVVTLISALLNQEDIDISNNLFLALGNLIIHVSEKLNEECVQQLATFFIEVLDGTNANFTENDEICRDIQNGFFYAFKCYVLSGLVVKIDFEETIEALHSKINPETRPQLFALANLALSRIAFINPEISEELVNECIQNTSTIILQSPKSIEVKINLLAALCFLTTSHFALFNQEILSALVPLLVDIISSDSDKSIKSNAALIMICIASNGVELDIEAALSLIPTESNEEDIVLLARSAVNLEEAIPALFESASIPLLASYDWILAITPQEIIEKCISVAASKSEEELDDILNFSEELVTRIKSRLPQ